jgi:uncharacterized membrane protein YccC
MARMVLFWPSRLRFSLLTFLSAICAYFAALALGLELPLWSFATVYVVAHPTRGMLRSKSMWRGIGTIAGALYTVLVLAQLPPASFVLGAAISLWIGLCMFLTLIDRAPRSNSFMLAGYTTVLIVFPNLALHEPLVNTAFARAAEVLLGCLSGWLFGEVLARAKVGTAALALCDAWLADARGLIRRALSAGKAVTTADLARLSRQATQIHTLLRHARYESLRHMAQPENPFALE